MLATVYRQMTRLDEAVTTRLTRVRLDPRMKSVVDTQIAGVTKGLGTVGTLVWTVAGVLGAHVGR